MRIAILGATSHIAQDLIWQFSIKDNYELFLFARRPEAITDWLLSHGIKRNYHLHSISSFTNNQQFDALINFVGVGNPAKTAALGSSIFDITLRYDQVALDYLQTHPNCRYIFFSSGAVYGNNFDEAPTINSHSLLPINNIESNYWYGIAKLHAEARHRAMPTRSITDVRIFNYFSRTVDLNARFLITDLLRAIRSNEVFQTSITNIVRDYAGPNEVHQLVNRILKSNPMNCAVDCYTRSPVDKITMLETMSAEFGLIYKLVPEPTGVTATGTKTRYYSLNYSASELFDYYPTASAIDILLIESHPLLS